MLSTGASAICCVQPGLQQSTWKSWSSAWRPHCSSHFPYNLGRMLYRASKYIYEIEIYIYSDIYISFFIKLILFKSLPQQIYFLLRKRKSSTYNFPISYLSYIQVTEEGLSSLFSNSHYREPEIMVFSAWMQTSHLSGSPWKDLICSTSQYSVSVKGSQTHTWTFF